jgi:hypothetical protein
MKSGKVILGIVATVCTAAGALAMKGGKKFTGGKTCYTRTGNTFNKIDCWTLNGHTQGMACSISGQKYVESGDTFVDVNYCTVAR